MQPQNRERDVGALTVQALSAALGERLVAVVLFGSRARDETTEASDWDLLVVIEGLPESPLERRMSLKRLLPPGCEAVSLLPRTPEEFEDHVPSLYLDIALEGKVLYDPRGYMTERLARLRRLIEELGLRREWTEAGEEWHWKKEPAGSWALRWEG